MNHKAYSNLTLRPRKSVRGRLTLGMMGGTIVLLIRPSQSKPSNQLEEERKRKTQQGSIGQTY